MPIEAIHRQLANEYLHMMKNRNLPQKPVCIIFSGVPGSGKTTLARMLARDLSAQYIRHDDIRELARNHGYDVAKLTISSISRIVMDTIMENDANKLVIVDASLDRMWPLFFEHTTKYEALPIIIRLEVPRSIVERRIHRRDKDDFGYITNLDEFYTQLEDSKKHVPATMTLGLEYEYNDVLRRVEELIR